MEALYCFTNITADRCSAHTSDEEQVWRSLCICECVGACRRETVQHCSVHCIENKWHDFYVTNVKKKKGIVFANCKRSSEGEGQQLWLHLISWHHIARRIFNASVWWCASTIHIQPLYHSEIDRSTALFSNYFSTQLGRNIQRYHHSWVHVG